MTDASRTHAPGWTGIQYSVFRGALALAAAHVCWVRLPLVEGPSWPLLALGLPGAIAFALGWRDRAVATALFVLVAGLAAFVDGAPIVLPASDVIFTASLLFFHLFVPITPFGSWDARGRIDPRGDWHRPAWIGHVAWAWLALIHLERALGTFGIAPRSAAAEELWLAAGAFAVIQGSALVALFVPRLRPFVWIALTLAQTGWIAATGVAPGDGILLLVHAFAADPAWWPGRSFEGAVGDEDALLFYDGDCGFCHRSVRFVLSEEANTPDALRLRFAPLASETFERRISARDDVDATDLPDSIVVLLEDGRLLTQSAALLELASRLGGLWRGLALVASLVPEGLRDAAYDAFARIRKKLFAQPTDACPILPPDLRARFDH
ncbi:MAG: DUF393 domain-containing protein [bacterium]|nr:DUF393 domain-containing protein [bacterium]